MKFDHLLLTRFNVSFDGSGRGLDPEWLDHRFDLFDRFCYPSVRTQSSQEFRWLVFFDQQTSPAFRERIQDYSAWPGFTPVFLDRWSPDRVRAEVARVLRPQVQYVITSRVDNDDALAVDFMERVQAEAAGKDFEYLNFPVGYVWEDGRIYELIHWSNPFVSLTERVRPGEPPRTVFSMDHMEVFHSGNLRQIDGPPVWLMVVHSRNVINQRAGIRQPIEKLTGRFAVEVPIDGSRENPVTRDIASLIGKGRRLAKRAYRRLRGAGPRVIDG